MSGSRGTPVLRTASEITVHFDSSQRVVIQARGDMFRVDHLGLAILDVFSEPISVSEALDLLRSRISSLEQWVELSATIMRLWEGGVLRDSDKTESSSMPTSPLTNSRVHARMLNDRKRTEAFLDAIKVEVSPSDVVVDIGTGTGVLAVAAAKAGARHVYAIEARAIADVAQEVFDLNRVSDKVTLIRGWSDDIELPERANVLVTETIGNEPLAEGILNYVLDARSRLLTPDARLIPHRLRVLALPVELPTEVLNNHSPGEDRISDWRSWYGVDLTALLSRIGANTELLLVRGSKVSEWTLLGDPVALVDIDLGACEASQVDTTVSGIVKQAGSIDAVVGYFEAELAPGVRLSTDPRVAQPSSSWRCPVWVFGRPLNAEENDAFELRYISGMGGLVQGVTLIHE